MAKPHVVVSSVLGVYDDHPGDVLRWDVPGIAFQFGIPELEAIDPDGWEYVPLQGLLSAFQSMAGAGKRIWDRDFVVFYGLVSPPVFPHGQALLVHLVPTPSADVLNKYIRKTWDDMGLDVGMAGSAATAKVYELQPILRYQRGGVVLYGSLTADEDVPSYGEEVCERLLPEGWSPDWIEVRRAHLQPFFTEMEAEPIDEPHDPPPRLPAA